MRILFKCFFLLFLLLPSLVEAGLPPTKAREVDGDPNFTAFTYEFPNGSLTQSGSKATISFTGGGSVPSSRTITIDGTANEVTSSAGAQDLSANRTWTLSLPSAIDISGKNIKIPSNATPPSADCDEAGEAGRLIYDTNATSGQRIFACEGAGGWVLQGDAGGAGAGDVTDAGDCTGGACGDGTSDGGTYYRLYDGDSHYGQYDAVDLNANRTWSGPNATGTFVLEDNTATLTNKTLAAADNVITADDTICTDCLTDTEVTTHAGTSLAADLEEEVTEGSLADSTIVSADVKDGELVNADISGSAAIAFSKLAALTSANILVGNGSNVATSVAMSGDITIDNAGATAIGNDKVVEADLKAVDAAADEDIFTFESTTGDFEWHTVDQMIANMSAGGLPNDSILEADLKAVDAASDEECLTFETTTGDFEWQSCGSGGGDSITVNTSAATDPDFANGDIDWTLTGGNSITATVGCTDCVAGTEISLASEAAGDVMYYNGTDWVRLAKGTAGQVLEMNSGATAPEWDTDDGTKSPREYLWPSAALLPLEHAADSIPPISKKAGTNVDILTRSFDGSTDECVGGTFLVPSDVNTGGTVTFRTKGYAATASCSAGSCEVIMDIRHVDRDDAESWDAALTTVADGACTISGTANTLTECTWTETITNLSWEASDTIEFEVCRDANNASDDLTGDFEMLDFSVEIPRA